MKRVFKFGGASVKDPSAVRNMSEIIRNEYRNQELLIIVVSAMGKTTNSLENILFKSIAQESYSKEISELEMFHREIILGLNLNLETSILNTLKDLIDKLKVELLEINNSDQISEAEAYDRIVSFGEIISTKIIAFYLEQVGLFCEWLDARKYIKTSDDYREGIIHWETTNENISQLEGNNKIYVTQGFIGSNSKGKVTTLGREGSDFTAAIFGQGLNSESITIWKDVPGILNADPKLFEKTTLFQNLSYDEASEMTYYGASVIHPKTIKPLANKHIPLLVKSFMSPSNPGTVISEKPSALGLPVIILKRDQALLSFKVKDFTFINEEQIGVIFHALSASLVKINVMQNSAISLTIAIDNRLDKIEKLKTILEVTFDIEYLGGLSLITIINHEEETITKVLSDLDILLEQRTLKTCQYLVSGEIFK